MIIVDASAIKPCSRLNKGQLRAKYVPNRPSSEMIKNTVCSQPTINRRNANDHTSHSCGHDVDNSIEEEELFGVNNCLNAVKNWLTLDSVEVLMSITTLAAMTARSPTMFMTLRTLRIT